MGWGTNVLNTAKTMETTIDDISTKIDALVSDLEGKSTGASEGEMGAFIITAGQLKTVVDGVKDVTP